LGFIEKKTQRINIVQNKTAKNGNTGLNYVNDGVLKHSISK
jgi:hypothetical protein